MRKTMINSVFICTKKKEINYVFLDSSKDYQRRARLSFFNTESLTAIGFAVKNGFAPFEIADSEGESRSLCWNLGRNEGYAAPAPIRGEP